MAWLTWFLTDSLPPIATGNVKFPEIPEDVFFFLFFCDPVVILFDNYCRNDFSLPQSHWYRIDKQRNKRYYSAK